MIKKTCLILYYIFASKLPNSTFPLGKLFNNLRTTILSKVITLGEGCKIQRNVYIGNGTDISIGSNCQINDNVRLDNIKIGNKVMIARDCIMLGKMHESSNINVPMIEQGEKPVSPTVIEDNVWIGARVIIMPGLLIKSGTIVAAGAVLTKSTESNRIYAGVPAKEIKRR